MPITLVMKTRRYRIFLWQTLIPLLVLPVFAAFLIVSPVARDWDATRWTVIGCVVAGGALAYLWNAWRNADLTLNERGVAVWVGKEQQTWPYEKLLKIKQTGKYRVRLCFDPDIPDKHMHVTADLFHADDFVDELLDRYEEVTGHELPELPDHEQSQEEDRAA